MVFDVDALLVKEDSHKRVAWCACHMSTLPGTSLRGVSDEAWEK